MKARCAFLIILKFNFRFLIIFIFAIFAATLTAGPALTELGDNLSQTMGIIARQKSQAEESASLLKRAHRNKKISNQELAIGQAFYGNAKADFDGWLTEMQNDLDQGRTEPTKESKRLLENAVRKSKRFISYVDELVCGEPRGAVMVVAIAGLVTAITNAAIKIYQEYRKANKEDRKRLVEELEKLKWKPFNQIS